MKLSIKSSIKKILFILIILMCFITVPVSALNVNSKNVVLYKLDNKEKVFGLKSNEKVSIASLTKIMTVIVAIENLKSLDQEITITKDMIKGLVEQEAYVVGLKEGQKVTYRDLLYSSLIASGADATNAIAIGISGSIPKYVKLMNQKAKELGLNNTSFANPIGLDDKNNYSTTEEVAKLLMYAYDNKTFKEIFETKEYEFKDKSLKVESSLIHHGKRVNLDTSMILGAKTGYDIDAGRCLASIAYDKKNDIYYLLVTTKADDDTSVMYNIKDAVDIYNYFFDNYSYHDLIKKNDDLVSIKTKYLKDDEVTFKSDKQVKLYYNNNNFNKKNIKITYSGIKEIKPFTKKGSTLGTVSVYYKDKLIDKIDIKLTEKPKLDIKKVIVGNYFTIISILIFVFAIVAFYFAIKRYIKAKRKKYRKYKRYM